MRKLRSQRCDGIILVGGGFSGDSYLEKLDQQLRAIENQGGGVVMLAPHELGWPSISPETARGASGSHRSPHRPRARKARTLDRPQPS